MALALCALGAWAMAWHGGLQDVFWIRATTMAAAIAGGAALAVFDRRWGHRGYSPILLAVTVVGIYETVPDPGDALVLLGVALPIAVLGWPRPLLRVGSAGSFAVAGVLAWVVARGGYGRQSSIVGGIACFGLLAVEPLIRGFRRRAWSPLDLVPPGWTFAPVVAGVHLALVYTASRVAGLRANTPMAPGGPVARGGVSGAVTIVVAELTAALIVAGGLRWWTVLNGRGQPFGAELRTERVPRSRTRTREFDRRNG
jgi:hypothetical protein